MRLNINDYLSVKIRFVSLLLIILVVFIHSYNLNFTLPNNEYSIVNVLNRFVQEVISQGIARVAVPLFFVISSLLFFNTFDLNVDCYKSKIKKRIYTLLVPYLFWSLSSFLIFYFLQKIPILSAYFNNSINNNIGFVEILDVVLFKPIVFQFWFIKDLMFLVVASPVIYYLVSSCKSIFLFVLFILWIFNIDLYLISNEAFFYFSLGLYLLKCKYCFYIGSLSFKKVLLLNTFWCVILLIKTICLILVGDVVLLNYLHKISICIGILSVWFTYDAIEINIHTKLRKYLDYSEYTFFIYAFHIPFLGLLQKTFMFILGRDEISLLFVYIVTPVITIVLAFVIARYLKSNIKSIYSVITGDR